MAYYPCIFGNGGGGIPAQLQSDMNAVFNKKFGTTGQSYASSEWADDVNLMGLLPEKTASGSIASFSDGADDVPIKSGKFYITASQTGSGTPSPSNPRPIVGYTGMTIHRADNENPHVVDTTYPVTWQTEAGTVYGGYFNSDTGVLTVTWKIIDMGNLSWSYDVNNLKFGTTISDMVNSSGYNQPSPLICSSYNVVNQAGQGSTVADKSIYVQDNVNKKVWCVDNDYTDATAFTTAVTGQKLVYELATPLTYTLTAQEIDTLLGDNNIWCDTGDCEVTYRQNVVLPDYSESWIIKSGASDYYATIIGHNTYSNGALTSYDVKAQAGGATVVNGDITTRIGSDTNWLWKVTATAAMTYRLYNVNTGELSALLTAQANDVIINDGDLNNYCIEIRRYS